MQNQKEILDFLEANKEKDRYVDKGIDQGDKKSLEKLHSMIQKWIKSLSKKEFIDSNGKVKQKAGTKTVDVLNKLKIGQKQAVQKVKNNKIIEEEFNIKNYELLVWFVIQGK